MIYDFSFAKRMVGVYFNDGERRFSVQVGKGQKPDEKLVAAIKKQEVFLKEYGR